MIIDFNITNFCNAKCPTCKRFSQDSYLEVEKNLKILHMNFEDFKNVIERNADFFKGKTCHFCGEFGDPLMHPNIKEFAELANKTFSSVYIYSNGGINRKSFFEYVAETRNNITFIFGIDGLTQEINSKYRINVNTDLAYNNMLFLAKHDKAAWDYTVFEHNKHELTDVIKFAKTHNIKLNFRCNLRPSIFDVNRISKSDYKQYKKLSKQYNNDRNVSFDTFWIDQL